MNIRLHRGDLPADLSLGADRRRRHGDHGPQSPARPALPGAALGRRRQLRAGADPAGQPHRPPNLTAADGRPRGAEDLPFRPLRRHRPEAGPGHRLPAGLLHQDRLAAGRAPSPTAMASRICARTCWGSSCPSSSNPPIGAPPELTPEQLRYAATDVLHLHALRRSSRRCWRARGAANWPNPASPSCRRGRRSIWAAGTSPTFLPTKSFAGLLNCD